MLLHRLEHPAAVEGGARGVLEQPDLVAMLSRIEELQVRTHLAVTFHPSLGAPLTAYAFSSAVGGGEHSSEVDHHLIWGPLLKASACTLSEEL